MLTTDLASIERGLWVKGNAWLAATALPSTWFILEAPYGFMDIDGMMRVIDTDWFSGVRMVDSRAEQLTEDCALLSYRAVYSVEGEARRVWWCTSTYLRFKRRWRLAHHQRTPAATQ